MSTAITEYVPKTVIRNKAKAADFLGVPIESLYNYLRNLWPQSGDPLTDAECYMGLALIARYELDPATRDIYLVRMRQRLSIIVALDGWVKILDRTDGYDGFEQSEEFDEKGDLRCVETRIYSKFRSHPTTYRAYMSEYRRVSGDVATKMPWHMLGVFSLRHAARLFTPVGGSVMLAEEAGALERFAATDQKKGSLREKVAAAAAAATEVEVEPIQQVAADPAREVSAPVAGDAEVLPGPATPAEPVVHDPNEMYKSYAAQGEQCVVSDDLKSLNGTVTACRNDSRWGANASAKEGTMSYLEGCQVRLKQARAAKKA